MLDNAGRPPGRREVRVVTDPVLAELHRSVLLATGGEIPVQASVMRRLQAHVRADAWNRISADDRRAVQSDLTALASLHLACWTAASKLQR